MDLIEIVLPDGLSLDPDPIDVVITGLTPEPVDTVLDLAASTVEVVFDGPDPSYDLLSLTSPTVDIVIEDLPSLDLLHLGAPTIDLVFEGIPGIPGSAGDFPAPETYPLTAASSWYQVHGFPYLPSVRLIDATGHAVFADISYPDASHVALSFPSPFTGTAVLS